MKGIFTILNYYFSPGRWAAQWPLTTAPAAVGDRNLHFAMIDFEKIVLFYPFVTAPPNRFNVGFVCIG